jgi:DNA polymerase III gamma/tau subunit
MSAAFDFTAERRMIEASSDPYEVLDWIGEYRRHALGAGGELAHRFDDLIEFATEHVVELKAAARRPQTTARPEPTQAGRAPALLRDAPVPQTATASSLPFTKVPTADPNEAHRREAARRRAEQDAAAKAAAEEARADDEELRQLQERTARAKARRDAALAETARIEAEAKRAADEAKRSRREQAKRAAAREAHAAERAASEAEAANRVAAKATAKLPPRAANNPTSRPTTRAVEARAETPAATAEEELTPLAALFQEPLTEVMAEPATTGPEPTPRRKIEPPAAHPARPVPAPLQAVGRQPVVPATPPPAPADDLPPLTGADLTSFRTWLGASQRALAAKLRVEQSSIYKGEGRPTTVLAPHLRKALHLAMQEPRDAARGAS